MPISVRCKNPDCGKALRVQDDLAGRRVKCPACGQIVSVPDGRSDTRDRPARSRTTSAAADLGRDDDRKPMPDTPADSEPRGRSTLRKIYIALFVGIILFPPFHSLSVFKVKQGLVSSFFDRNTGFILSPPAQGNLLYPWTINWGRLMIELAVVAGLAAVVLRSRRKWVTGAAVALALGGGVMVYVYEEEKLAHLRTVLDRPPDPPDKEKPPEVKPPAWNYGDRHPPHPRLGPPTEATPLPAELVAAWKKGGFDAGWMDLVGDGQFYGGKDGKPGQVPAFRPWAQGARTAGLPAPDAAFGLCFSTGSATDAALKDLAGFKNLQVLTLESDQGAVTEAGLMELGALEQLQSLSLRGARVTDAVLKEFGRLLNLRALRLANAPATDAGLKHLAGMTQLQSLDLGHIQGLTDAGLKHLGGMKDLQWLCLTHTGVTDAGLKELVPLTKLQYLELANVAVTDRGLEDLKRMKQLRHLDILFTKASAAGVEDLHRALPDCKIFGYPGG